MPRPLWRGSLSFGLVNVPVALFSAVRDLDVHFHQLHTDSHARLEVRRVCTKGKHEVPYEEIGYGYDLDGKEVVLSQEELDAAQPEKTRTIDISEFVDVGDIDPVFYDHAYHLVPIGEGEARPAPTSCSSRRWASRSARRSAASSCAPRSTSSRSASATACCRR
jgi:DNA end-binding protein Ku